MVARLTTSRRPIVLLIIVAFVALALVLIFVQLAGRDVRLSATVLSQSPGACYLQDADIGLDLVTCVPSLNESECISQIGFRDMKYYHDPGRPCRPIDDPGGDRCSGAWVFEYRVVLSELEDERQDPVGLRSACAQGIREQQDQMREDICNSPSWCSAYRRPTSITYVGLVDPNPVYYFTPEPSPVRDDIGVVCRGLLYCGLAPASSPTSTPG